VELWAWHEKMNTMQVKAIPITCFILISLWFYKLEINENRGCIILTRERISPIFSLLPHLATSQAVYFIIGKGRPVGEEAEIDTVYSTIGYKDTRFTA